MLLWLQLLQLVSQFSCARKIERSQSGVCLSLPLQKLQQSTLELLLSRFKTFSPE